MKKIITILLVVLLYNSGYSQSWHQVPSLASQVSARNGYFSIGDTGYIIAGGNTWYVPQAWGYDTLTQQWFQIANYPGNDDDPISFSIQGKGYCVTGGDCCPSYSNSLYEYDPYPVNTWTQLTSLPGAQRTFAVGFTIGDTLYVGGGVNDSATASNSNPLKDFWKYVPSTATWTRIADCPAAGVNAFAVGFAINGKGYVGTGGMGTFGSSNYVPQQDFWEYDPSNNTWAPTANFGGGVRAGAVAWVSCNKAYVGTGYTDVNQSIYTNDIWQYDPTSDAWTQVANYEGKPRKFASVFVVGNTAFVGNGSVSTVDTNDFYEYAGVLAIVPPTPSICDGKNIELSAVGIAGSYTWNTGATNDSISINPSKDSLYIVIVTHGSCIDTSSDEVTVSQAQPLSIQPQSPSISCGQSVALNVTDSGTNFNWSPSTGLSDTLGDTVVADPTLTTVYLVTGIDSNGCLSTGTDSVLVIAATPLTILPQPGPLFCSGLSAELKVQGGGSNFIWTPTTGLSDTTSGDSVLASPLTTTTYTVTGNDSAGCASSGIEMVTVIASPNKPTFYQHGDTLSSSATTDNQWYRNDTLLTGDTSQNLIIYSTSPNEYYVVVNNEANGCSASSDTVATTGINQLLLINNQLSIYPNPFNNGISINVSSSAQDVKDWKLQIIDVLGRTVYSRQSLNYNNDIDLSDLSSGVYFITVINKTGRAVVSVVKQN